MKTKLLRKVRKLNVIYQRNNEYRFMHKKLNTWNDIDVDWETDWVKDKRYCFFLRRESILKQARKIYKPTKKIL
jgi:hypothetical protein